MSVFKMLSCFTCLPCSYIIVVWYFSLPTRNTMLGIEQGRFLPAQSRLLHLRWSLIYISLPSPTYELF